MNPRCCIGLLRGAAPLLLADTADNEWEMSIGHRRRFQSEQLARGSKFFAKEQIISYSLEVDVGIACHVDASSNASLASFAACRFRRTYGSHS